MPRAQLVNADKVVSVCRKVWALLGSDFTHVQAQLVIREIDEMVSILGTTGRRAAFLFSLRKLVSRARDSDEAAFARGPAKRIRFTAPVPATIAPLAGTAPLPRLELWSPAPALPALPALQGPPSVAASDLTATPADDDE